MGSSEDILLFCYFGFKMTEVRPDLYTIGNEPAEVKNKYGS